jgi:hypothetical protein
MAQWLFKAVILGESKDARRQLHSGGGYGQHAHLTFRPKRRGKKSFQISLGALWPGIWSEIALALPHCTPKTIRAILTRNGGKNVNDFCHSC